MAWYEISAVEAGYQKPNWKPEGPIGWSFSVVSEPVDGGAPHRQLLETVAASFPALHLTLAEYDNSGDYLDGVIDWEGSKVFLWSERQEGFLYVWSIEREPVERLRSEAGKRAPEFF